MTVGDGIGAGAGDGGGAGTGDEASGGDGEVGSGAGEAGLVTVRGVSGAGVPVPSVGWPVGCR